MLNPERARELISEVEAGERLKAAYPHLDFSDPYRAAEQLSYIELADAIRRVHGGMQLDVQFDWVNRDGISLPGGSIKLDLTNKPLWFEGEGSLGDLSCRVVLTYVEKLKERPPILRDDVEVYGLMLPATMQWDRWIGRLDADAPVFADGRASFLFCGTGDRNRPSANTFTLVGPDSQSHQCHAIKISEPCMAFQSRV